MKTPDIKQNPHPKMRYEITLTIHDAPGPFESITGSMQYEVTNKRCSPENPMSGTWNPPHVNVPFTFTPLGDGVYIGNVYLDLMQDEDYYGLGVCHWQIRAAFAGIKVNEVTFSPDISSDKIATQQSLTTYFPKKAYADTSIKDMHDGGMPMSDIVRSYRDEFFSVTLAAKEIAQ